MRLTVSSPFNRRTFRLLALIFILLALLCPFVVDGEVIVDGTKAQRDKIANFLTRSLGTRVTIGDDGKMSIAAGGNDSATRLRNMINDKATSVTLKLVEGDNTVSSGGWVSVDPKNVKGKTTGTQLIDIRDLEGIGNVINSFGLTPDAVLMHEITEVYEGKKGNLDYEDAHKKGVEAEDEELAQHGTSYVAPRLIVEKGFVYRKIKRPDGSFVVVKVKPYVDNEDTEWFREKVPCDTTKGLIAIPDPDPQVHLFTYDAALLPNITATIDRENSFPTGVDFDEAGNIYVTENLEGQDEVRIFTRSGEPVGTIRGEEMVDPEGIEIDRQTGDIFVAVRDRVVRYKRDRNFVGSYSVSGQTFRPTDVAVWRNVGTEDIFGDNTEYDIFVTDRESGQVYRFKVDGDMNTGRFLNVFGKGLLDSPEGISIDSWYSVWVASTGNNRIYRFAPNGQLEPFGTRQFFIEEPSRLLYDMEMIEFDGVYVVDGTRGKGALLLYDYDGNLKNTYGEGALQCPTSIATYFAVNLENLISIPDPGSDDPVAGGGWSTLTKVLIVVAVLIVIALVFVLATGRLFR